MVPVSPANITMWYGSCHTPQSTTCLFSWAPDLTTPLSAQKAPPPRTVVVIGMGREPPQVNGQGGANQVLFELNTTLISKLLNALPECTECAPPVAVCLVLELARHLKMFSLP